MWYNENMANALRQAIEEAQTLPPAAQQKIGEELKLHIEKLRRLQAKLDRGIASLEAGEARELGVEEIIRRARAQYGEN